MEISNPDNLALEQIQIIRDHLQLVFEKETPDRNKILLEEEIPNRNKKKDLISSSLFVDLNMPLCSAPFC